MTDIKGFDKDLVQKELLKYWKKQVKIESKMAGIKSTIKDLKKMYIMLSLESKGISIDDPCIMVFEESEEKIQCCNISYGYLSVYHFTAKGQMHKNYTCYNYYYVDHLKPIKKGIK